MFLCPLDRAARSDADQSGVDIAYRFYALLIGLLVATGLPVMLSVMFCFYALLIGLLVATINGFAYACQRSGFYALLIGLLVATIIQPAHAPAWTASFYALLIGLLVATSAAPDTRRRPRFYALLIGLLVATGITTGVDIEYTDAQGVSMPS